MGKDNNLHDYLSDIADAIREKKDSTGSINAQDFSTEIRDIPISIWTGHADIEGLKAIGWDDEDIAYYQRYGVNWNEEDDQYHKVSEDNKTLYGVLTVQNYKEYKDRIEYLPKLDFSRETTAVRAFEEFNNLIAVPHLDFSNTSYLIEAFYNCSLLTCIPPFKAKITKDFNRIFYNCSSLCKLPYFNISSNAELRIDATYYGCRQITSIPQDVLKITGSAEYLFGNCENLYKTPILKFVNVINTNRTFNSCKNLRYAMIEGLAISVSLSDARSLSKESLIYIINNESATSAITITLHSAAYARLSTDPDIVAALNNHPLVTLASA